VRLLGFGAEPFALCPFSLTSRELPNTRWVTCSSWS
jgi:hypothetical protein